MNRRNEKDYRKALDVLKKDARLSNAPAWTDGEWRILLARAGAQKKDAEKTPAVFSLRPLATAAAALLVLIWGAFFLSKNGTGPNPIESNPALSEIAVSPTDGAETHSDSAALAPVERSISLPAPGIKPATLVASAAGRVKPSEDKPAFTWISQETGLKIVWFTNNNLKLED
jgi:hypothetical protein